MGMDIYGLSPRSDRNYFRSNAWSWRPIHVLCEIVLERELPGWGYNDGAGLRTQPECDQLADALEKHLHENPQVEYLDVDYGTRVVSRIDVRVEDKDIMEHGAKRTRVEAFIRFLRHCGGFEIR